MKALLILFTATLLLSCKTAKETMSENSIPKDPVIVATVGDFPEKSDPVTIDKIEIRGNEMLVSVSYSGGCGNHVFQLIGSPQIAKSMPPIRNVKLFHTSENDQCKKMITRVLHFDIKALAYKQEVDSEIYLMVDGQKDKVKYTYTIDN